jgi:hypothetical protein
VRKRTGHPGGHSAEVPPPQKAPRSAQRAVSVRAETVGEVPVGSLPAGGPNWSFDGVVRRVLGFSRAAELEGEANDEEQRDVAAPGSKRRGPVTRTAALEGLNVFVRSLEEEMRQKLEAVIRAGREGQTLPEARATIERETTADPATAEVFREGAVALQHLQRGHALAYATGFHLELALQRWSSVRERGSLDERVWLRFGRELAESTPGQWSCWALVDASGQIIKLYLRRESKCWWSFERWVDRPSDRQVTQCRSVARGRNKFVQLTLDAFPGRRCRGDRAALRRAHLAMSARLGSSRMPSSAPGRSS